MLLNPPFDRCKPSPGPHSRRRREESDPRYITAAANVKLRSFSTSVHAVEAMVSYRAD